MLAMTESQYPFLERCGTNMTDPVHLQSYSGTLTSQNYPNSYESNTNCYWKITAPSGFIEFHFTNFDIRSPDYLTVSTRDLSC